MVNKVDVMVGRRLRARRRLLGITLQELARDCGVTYQQVQKYEGAVSRMSAHMLWKLACALDVDVGYFFNGLSELDSPVACAESRRKPEALQA